MFSVIRALCLIVLLVMIVFFAWSIYPWVIAVIAFYHWLRRFGF